MHTKISIARALVAGYLSLASKRQARVAQATIERRCADAATAAVAALACGDLIDPTDATLDQVGTPALASQASKNALLAALDKLDTDFDTAIAELAWIPHHMASPSAARAIYKEPFVATTAAFLLFDRVRQEIRMTDWHAGGEFGVGPLWNSACTAKQLFAEAFRHTENTQTAPAAA